MKQVYIAENHISAHQLKDYLLNWHIETFVKGELLLGGVGELPADTFPTLWVVDDDDYDRALALINKYMASPANDQIYDSVWKCDDCDELIEAQFTQCWHCGKERSP